MPRSREAGAIPNDGGSTARHAGLDWIRGLGAVAVVVLHAGIPYLTAPMPGLAWPIRHPAPDAAINAVFWAIEACVMPLFLMLSGYVSWRSLSHRGERKFLRQRVDRILYPLLAAACILLPVELYLWMLGWVGEGQLSWKDLRDIRLGSLKQNLWGLSHLWYLQYIFLYSLLLAAGVWGLRRRPAQAASGRRSAQWPTPNLRRLAIPSIVAGIAAVLCWDPGVVLGFQHSFVPVPAKFAYSGLFFAWGVLEAVRPDEQPRGRRRNPLVWLGAAALLFPTYLLLADGQMGGQPPWVATPLLTAMCVTLTFGLWSICERLKGAPPAWARYLAGASFWVYLVHHPLVPLCQLGFRETGWPAQIQFALAIVVTLYLALASYEVAVRRTVIGSFLGGRETRETAVIAQFKPQPLRHAA